MKACECKFPKRPASPSTNNKIQTMTRLFFRGTVEYITDYASFFVVLTTNSALLKAV